MLCHAYKGITTVYEYWIYLFLGSLLGQQVMSEIVVLNISRPVSFAREDFPCSFHYSSLFAPLKREGDV